MPSISQLTMRKESIPKVSNKDLVLYTLLDGDHIYKAKYKGEMIVVKCLPYTRESYTEIKIHSFLAPSFAPKVYCWGKYKPDKNKDEILIIGMEVLKGTLWEYILQYKDSKDKIIHALYDIVLLLERTHVYLFMHRDLHASNIMYKEHNHKVEWFFIDFNMAYIQMNQYRVYNVTQSDHYNMIHSFNPSHDIKMLCISLHDVIPYILRIQTQRTFNDTYGNIVHIIDYDYVPSKLLKYLETYIE